MESDHLFKIPLNLEHLSVINLAVNYWKHKDVQSLLLDYVLKLESPIAVGESNEEWTIVTDYAVKFIEELSLPKKLENKIKNMTIIVGEKILYWYQHVYFHLGFDIQYAEDICWTTYGKIDEVKIFQKYWSKDAKFPNSKCVCFLKKPLFCMACIYADMHFIRNNFAGMKQVISGILPVSYTKGISTEYGLIAIWLCFCISGDQKKGLELLNGFMKSADEIPAVELFQMCVSSGLKFAAKYFWKKLNTDEKQIIVLTAAKQCVLEYVRIGMYPRKRGDIHNKENLLDILLFLINEMSLLQSSEFLTRHYFSLLDYFLENWPYQELCVKFVDKMDQFRDCDYFEVMLTMNECLLPITYKTHCYKNKIVYHNVFQKVLEKSPLDLKEELFITGIDYHPTIRNYYDNFDYVALSLLINDVDLKKKHKDHMLDLGVDFFKKLVLKGKYIKLNKFINHVFMSCEEEKCFKQRFNCLHTFLSLGKFELADKNLNWLSDSTRERIALKNQINPLRTYSLLIEMHNLDSADKFLSWRFDTDDERETIKKGLISNESLRNIIFKIWGKIWVDDSTDEIENKCTELLNWFFGSEEDITKFKKSNLIKNELFFKKIWDYMCYEYSFAFLDRFLKFCLMSPEEIKLMKEKISNNIIWWIDTYALEGNNFLMVDALISWVWKGEKQKKRMIIKRYMESLSGALLCVKMLRKAPHSSVAPAMHFYNFWVSLLVVDISVIKRNLNTFNGNFLAEETFSTVRTLLDDVEKGSAVGSFDLRRGSAKPKAFNYASSCDS